MTGNVKRLSELANNKLEGRYLLRGDSGTSCEVSLVFSGGIHIRRLQTVGARVTVVGNELAEVAKAIRASDTRWRVSAENVADYLHLTHFHPQTAELRLVSLDPDTRWLRVSPLAGADRFDRLRANLRAARTGLTRTTKLREQALALAIEHESSWTNRVREYQTNTLVDRAAYDVLAPPEARDSLQPILDQLKLPSPPGDAGSSAEIATLVANTRGELERAASSARAEEARLRGLAELPTSWARMRASVDSISSRKGKTEEALSEAATKQRESEKVFHQRSATLVAASAAVSATEQRHRLGSALRLNEDSLVRTVSQLESLATARETQETALNEKQAQLQGEVAGYARWQAESAAHRALEASIGATRSVLQRLSESFEVERQLEVETQRMQSVTAQLNGLYAAQAAFEVEMRATRVQRADVISRIDREAARLGELVRAVTAIATHLTEHDESCPVCKTAFTSGRLRELALEQSVASSVPLSLLRTELETAERNVVYLEAKGKELAADVRAKEQELTSLTAIASQLKAHVVTLRSDPLITPLEGAEERLQALISSRDAELRLLSSRIDSSPTAEVLSARLAAARLAVAETSRDVEASQAQFEKLTAERSELGARIASARESLMVDVKAEASELATTLARELASAERFRAVAFEEVGRAKAANEVSIQELEAARDASAAASAELARAQEGLATLRLRWSQAGLSGDPSEATLQGRLGAAANQQASLGEMSLVLAKIGSGIEGWQRLDATRRLQAALVSEAAGLSLDAHGEALREARLAAEKAVRAAKDAYEASEKLTGAVKDIGEGFGSTAIAPFADVFKAFLRALVRDGRFHRVNPEFARTQGGGNVLRFNLDLGEAASGAADFQVELVLSEGQLSEVSLAAMLAASCIYPWSRWRAVLLDDPTQYQDLTHTTSLFEVIRNLATEAGFQVVVAIHDRAQADFLLRKLASARVPYVECEYIAMGPHGALTRVTRSLEAKS